jgi:hypothetical protein
VVVPGAVGWLVAHVPGAGLVRDGTRFVALVAPLQAVLFGLGVARAVAAVGDRRVGLSLGTVLVLSPVTVMPDAALGLSGRLAAVSFPQEYAAARTALAGSRRAGHAGDVLALPFTSYRQPGWNGGRRTLDPVGRYFPVDYLASDTLVVSGRTIAGEDQRAERVAAHLGALDGVDLEQALARERIGWVVLDASASRALSAEGVDDPEYGIAPVLSDARVLHEGELLTVWELPQDAAVLDDASPRAPGLLLLGLAWLAAAVTFGGAAALVGLRGWNTWRQMRRSG